MTTIATDGLTMVGDGQRTHLGTITNRKAKKVRRLSDGTLVGTSGDVGFGDAVVAWLTEGGDAPKLEMDGGFTCLVLKPSGELTLMGQDCRPSVIEAPYAIGSGMDLAIGAMRAGASPEAAVCIACEYDEHSGGELTVLSLKDGLRPPIKSPGVHGADLGGEVRSRAATDRGKLRTEADSTIS